MELQNRAASNQTACCQTTMKPHWQLNCKNLFFHLLHFGFQCEQPVKPIKMQNYFVNQKTSQWSRRKWNQVWIFGKQISRLEYEIKILLSKSPENVTWGIKAGFSCVASNRSSQDQEYYFYENNNDLSSGCISHCLLVVFADCRQLTISDINRDYFPIPERWPFAIIWHHQNAQQEKHQKATKIRKITRVCNAQVCRTVCRANLSKSVRQLAVR